VPGIINAAVNDLTKVNGDLLLDGTLNVTPLAGFGVGVYRLFDYTGTLIDNGLDVGSLPAGLAGFIDLSTPNQVNLDVVAVPEPSTLVLASIGLLGLSWAVRRRRFGVR
jgi:fibronectin-binding autotransporter adhesin